MHLSINSKYIFIGIIFIIFYNIFFLFIAGLRELASMG